MTVCQGDGLSVLAVKIMCCRNGIHVHLTLIPAVLTPFKRKKLKHYRAGNCYPRQAESRLEESSLST